MTDSTSNKNGDSDADDTIAVTHDDEVLVAYLDGELPRGERGNLEQRLVNDEALRGRLQSLQKGWDLLELLPSPITTEQSVQSTLELVVDDIRRYSKSLPDSSADGDNEFGAANTGQQAKRKRLSLIRTGWLIPAVFTLVVFGIASWVYFRSSQTQVLDFPIAMDMDVYTLAENASLIEHLNSSTRWRRVVASTVIPDVEELIAIDGENSLFSGSSLKATAPSQKQLTRRLSDVATDQRLIALSRLERFEQLDPLAKQALRDSAAKIRQSPDFSIQLDTLRAYARWREQLSDELVDAIESETGAQREAAIETAIADTITSIGRATSRNLSNEAVERIDFTLIEIVKQRLDGESIANPVSNNPGEADQPNKLAPTQRLSRFLRQRGEFLDDPDAIYRMVAARIVFQERQREIPALTTSELELIQAMLPAKDAETLQRYVTDPWVRTLILEDWAQETLRRKTRGQLKAATLPELYDSLPAEQKEVVDLMPPDKARRMLMEISPQ